MANQLTFNESTGLYELLDEEGNVVVPCNDVDIPYHPYPLCEPRIPTIEGDTCCSPLGKWQLKSSSWEKLFAIFDPDPPGWEASLSCKYYGYTSVDALADALIADTLTGFQSWNFDTFGGPVCINGVCSYPKENIPVATGWRIRQLDFQCDSFTIILYYEDAVPTLTGDDYKITLEYERCR